MIHSASATAATQCKVCSANFLRLNSMQVVCGVRCARQVPVIAKRTARQQDAQKREALKTRKEVMQEAQQAFNAYIRLRDAGRRCICCGSAIEPQKPGGSADAGHYLSVGSAPNLRFNEANVHAQRKNCNRPGGTTRAAFRAGMIARIGLADVERLEADQTLSKHTIDELRGIRATYRAKAKALKSGGTA